MVRPRESNPRPPALQSNALPTELFLPRFSSLCFIHYVPKLTHFFSCISLTPILGQCLASAANDKVVVTYVKGDVYDTAEINAGVSVSKMLIQGCTIVVLT